MKTVAETNGCLQLPSHGQVCKESARVVRAEPQIQVEVMASREAAQTGRCLRNDNPTHVQESHPWLQEPFCFLYKIDLQWPAQ